MKNNVRQLNMAASTFRILLVLSLSIIGLGYLIQSQAFIIHTIRIFGDTAHINVPSVQEDVVRQIKGNFFTVNLNEVRNAFEKMPWIRRASVRRIWPDALLINVEEYKPLSIWGRDKIVSIEGDLFTGNQGELKGELPLLSGPEGSVKEVVAHYYDFTKWFAPMNVKLNRITLSSRYAWTIKLSNGIHVELGKERNNQSFNCIVQRLIAVWPAVTKRWGNNIEYIDLRYPNGFVIRCAKHIFFPGRYHLSKEISAKTSKSIL